MASICLPPGGGMGMLRRDSNQPSFCDQTLNDRFVKADHFLRHLDAIIDFGFENTLSSDSYPYNIALPSVAPPAFLKMIFFSISTTSSTAAALEHAWCDDNWIYGGPLPSRAEKGKNRKNLTFKAQLSRVLRPRKE